MIKLKNLELLYRLRLDKMLFNLGKIRQLAKPQRHHSRTMSDLLGRTKDNPSSNSNMSLRTCRTKKHPHPHTICHRRSHLGWNLSLSSSHGTKTWLTTIKHSRLNSKIKMKTKKVLPRRHLQSKTRLAQLFWSKNLLETLTSSHRKTILWSAPVWKLENWWLNFLGREIWRDQLGQI